MEADGRSISSWISLTLDLPPSCIEFCPASPDHFVVGTYNLQKEEASDATVSADEDADEQQLARKQAQSRNGSLAVFRLHKRFGLTMIEIIPYPSAILDLHFHPHRGNGEVFAVVSSTGTLSFFKVYGNDFNPLREIVTHKPLDMDEGVLFLSCAWHPSIPDLLAITTSNHEVHILRVDEAWNVSKAHAAPVITHTLEAWTVAFSPFLTQPSRNEADPQQGEQGGPQSFMIFSGGDDSKLLQTSCEYGPVRNDEDDEIIQTPWPTVSIRGHEAGVTAILPLNLKLADGSDLVVTGSYDDHIRVFSIPSQEGGIGLQKPRIVAEENLGGGVWRLKLVKLEEIEKEGTSDEAQRWRALVLASCMHAGSRVLEISGDYAGVCEVKVMGHFEEHKSMNYASDFLPGTELGGQILHCVSTSFYDKLLCIWKYE
ncbi:hypothetical protein F5B20DRAFT_532065 [Whalleya microplaca]|nr:hypothetical protein F5B20DRAFT_532065 [Whalleya microplaca]